MVGVTGSTPVPPTNFPLKAFEINLSCVKLVQSSRAPMKPVDHKSTNRKEKKRDWSEEADGISGGIQSLVLDLNANVMGIPCNGAAFWKMPSYLTSILTGLLRRALQRCLEGFGQQVQALRQVRPRHLGGGLSHSGPNLLL